MAEPERDTTTAEPGSGRIDENWLAKVGGESDGASEWELVSRQINNDNFRDVFIGNGYVGFSVPPEGEGSWVCPDLCRSPTRNRAAGGSLVHGFFDRNLLMSVPRWAGLRFCDGTQWFSRFNGIHRDYRQTLDMRHGVVTTELDWFSQENHERRRQKTHIEIAQWLSRPIRNLGVIQFRFTPDYDGRVTFEDSLDGSLCTDDSCEWRPGDIQWDNTMTLSARMGVLRKKVLVASKLLFDRVDGCTCDIGRTPRSLQRTLSFPVKAGTTVTVTKLVGIYTEQDGPDLEDQAAQMLNHARRRTDALFAEHCRLWEELWQSDIRCSNAGVQKLARAALYQFYAQLRPDAVWSLGPTGITGCLQWAGRAFWDADLWMAPPVMMLHPDLARCIVAYRHKTLDGARRNARAEGLQGARFAWESVEFGDETYQGVTAEQRHHIADIALVQWWYSLIAGDRDYAETGGPEVILECARYFAGRAEYNRKEDRYEIRRVCCADERSGIVDNNTYTNYAAVKTLTVASDILTSRGEPVPELWSEICRKMYYPYYPEIGTYREHETYVDQTIKQADTSLLIYPYSMPMTDAERRSIVEFYRAKYPPRKIMMSSAIDGVVFGELGDAESAWSCFLDLLPHFRLPGLCVSESPANECISFMTGLGGMLQLVINGFAGIRITPEGLEVKPALPAAIDELTITGLHCRGERFELTVRNGKVLLRDFPAKPSFAISVAEGVTLEGL